MPRYRDHAPISEDGQSERQIATAFQQAADDKAFLVFDEVDSLLYSPRRRLVAMARGGVQGVQEEQSEQTNIRKLLDWLIDRGINGVGPLQSASALAEEYLLDQSYKNNDARVQALIKWERSKHFTVGFLTGLGGVLTLPINVAAEIGAQWVLSARMSAAIAIIYGHSTKEDRVRTFILLTIVANHVRDVFREVGMRVGRGISKKLIGKVSGRALRDMQRRIGVVLITKAGKKSFMSLTRLIPVVGGAIGGIIDAVACQQTGRLAQRLFRQTSALVQDSSYRT